MSLLSIERLRIDLAPTGVRLARERGWWRRREVDSALLPCAADGKAPLWEGALAVLQEAMQQPRWQRTPLALTLSDRLVRYQLLPWLPELGSPDERPGYARFHFHQVYGALADDWDIQVDEAAPGMSAIACAADRALLAALDALASSAGTRIDSIRPHFAAVFNAVRRRLPVAAGKVAALALIEPGGLSLALLGGGWRSLRQRASTAAPAEALLDALEQERLLADPPFGQAPVYLVADAASAADLRDMPDLLGAGWVVHRLDVAGDFPQRGGGR